VGCVSRAPVIRRQAHAQTYLSGAMMHSAPRAMMTPNASPADVGDVPASVGQLQPSALLAGATRRVPTAVSAPFKQVAGSGASPSRRAWSAMHA